LHFNYRFPKKNPFAVSLIYEDGRFTYIACAAPEKPVLYEQTEDGPSVVSFSLQDGVYVTPKVLERGYLALGKQRMNFERSAR
jgi:type IV secretion system protein VirB9